MDVLVGVGSPEWTAVRPLHKAGENIATIDTVAADEKAEEVDEMAEDIGDEEQDDEEGQQPKVIRSPKAPTKAEREEHEATHLPFRSWCTHCLRGRGRNKPHQRQIVDREVDERKVPKISMDYFFMSQDK
jgi:hypothetical protein